MGQAGTFEIFFGQISAILRPQTTIEIWKIRDFVIFGQNWANFGKFFFQNEIFVEIGPQNTKNDFKRLLWILKMIFMHFMIIFDNLKIWVFENFLVSNRDGEPEMSQHDYALKSCWKWKQPKIMFFFTKMFSIAAQKYAIPLGFCCTYMCSSTLSKL